jgi:hypothetical protein
VRCARVISRDAPYLEKTPRYRDNKRQSNCAFCLSFTAIRHAAVARLKGR